MRLAQCPETPAWSKPQLALLLVILLGASLLRFSHLGYAEFQGDEGRAMLRAAEVLQGNDEVLLLHKKGPVEILVPAAIYGAVGHINEDSTRLPFAVANVAALLALALLGRRLFHPWAGLIAAALMAVDGFWIGFAHIVQYQSIVLLMTILAVWCGERVWRGHARPTRLLIVAALLASVGMLAHYEGVFALLPLGWLVLWRIWDERSQWRLWLRRLAVPVAVGALCVGAFYIPFVLYPQFQDTAVYLTDKRVGGQWLYNNAADFVQRAGFYNPIWHPVLLGLALTAVAWRQLWQAYAGRGRLMRAIVVLIGLAGFSICLFPGAWQVHGVSLAVIPFVVWSLLLILGPGSMPARTLAIWFAGSALLYFFMMIKVHTHYYVTYPAWALAIGAGGVWLLQTLSKRRALRSVTLGLVALFVALGAIYTWIAFVRHDPEFKRAYPEAKPALYWSPYGRTKPRGGYFGFPYATAWKAIGGLYAEGVLKGPYDSNQEDLVTNWYTRGAMRCPQADLFIVARDVEEPHGVIPEVITGVYRPMIEITRDGVPQLWVFQRGYNGTLATYRLEDYARQFDEQLSAPVFQVGAPLDEVFEPSHATPLRYGATLELVGWDLQPERAMPGNALVLTLYWRSLAATPASLHVFATIGDEPALAHADSVPACGQNPTYRWQPGDQVVDRHVLLVTEDAPDGVYPLRVGVYPSGESRLKAAGTDGADLGSTPMLGQVRVGSPDMGAATSQVAAPTSFGGLFRLEGYDLGTEPLHPGETLMLTAYWRCLQATTTSYTVFVHLVGPDGIIRGQADTRPRGGALPTDFWVPGELVSDSYTLTVDQNSPTGSYRIELGLYDGVSGQRLAAEQAGQHLDNDQVSIEGVQVAR